MLLARHSWRALGLDAIIDSAAQSGGEGPQLTDPALALAANRLCEPTSEHGIAR